MERRQLMAADPLHVGAVYVEEDGGSDLHGDTFYLTFEGGAPGTNLTRVVIDTDQNALGLGVGDLIFDTVAGGLGADQAQPFSLVSLSAKNPEASFQVTVQDGGTQLTLDLKNFQAGDKLVFTIDVDEIQQFDPNDTDPAHVNEGIDPITSGVEFQGSKIRAYFSAQHYYDVSGTAEFRNRYDSLLEGKGLDLPPDDQDGKRDRTAGTAATLNQQPLPISIAGIVYLESDLDLKQDAGEPGIPQVELGLWQKQDGGYVFTGLTTKTAADGSYEFGTDLNLLPGTYQIREVQPDGLFSVGAIPGTVDGTPTGALLPGSLDVLTEISIPLGNQHGLNFNFAEAQPARISGHVYHDRNDNGVRDAGEEGIAGISVQIVPVNTIASQSIVTATTNSEGYYEAVGLSPGMYRVVEPVQPTGYFDGKDAAGTVDGIVVGTAVNPGDTINDVFLGGGKAGVNYNFGEIGPASIQGKVCLSDGNGTCFVNDSAHPPIVGALILLLDANGKTLQQTTTDSQGRYSFLNLMPGEYKIKEVTPQELLDGPESVGTVGGKTVGVVETDDLISQIVLGPGQSGVDYNFCEYPAASLSGNVYHDSNNNGVRDSGETPIGGVELVLWNAAGQRIASTTTGSDGTYLFSRLHGGTYTLTETQPTGWIDGLDAAGTIYGGAVGIAHNPGDTLSGIGLGWGKSGIEYNFGELLSGTLAGRVHEDPDRDCVYDADEKPIGGVVIELLDASGNVLRTTKSDQSGSYRFDNLTPGTYEVRETQPQGYFHGGQHVGSHGGDASQKDRIRAIPVGSGQDLTEYDFCEIPPGSLAGLVHVDLNNNRTRESNENVIAGVKLELVDEKGAVIATTTSAADGTYKFDNLPPGTYTVRETQPAGYFDGGQRAGSGGGDIGTQDLIKSIVLVGGAQLTGYNFCEVPPSELSGYVFQDGAAIQTSDGQLPPDIWTLRNGQRTADDTPLRGVVLELRDGQTGVAIDASNALPGRYAAGPIRVTTDANGFYRFDGIRGNANYSIYEVHPGGYFDGLDTPGTTSGVAINPNSAIDPAYLEKLVVNPKNDAIIRINLGVAVVSQNNNFSEVQVETIPNWNPPLPPVNPPSSLPPMLMPPQVAIPEAPAGYINLVAPEAGGSGPELQTFASFHLSVIDAGMPRDIASAVESDPTLWTVATYLDFTNWESDRLSAGRWLLPTSNKSAGEDDSLRQFLFGVYDAIPVTGDFNGDGVTEVGVFYHGEWFIDLNGNGRWDQDDLWARLGTAGDRPVVGDWDGDGKDDIGIYGLEWAEDARAIQAEPGLPDSANSLSTKPKNVPPRPSEATDGRRLMRLSVSGPRRADVIDHVFRFGKEQDRPVAGDWNGDGIRTVGVFNAGHWKIDADGDGRFTGKDVRFDYGSIGDVPIVGDFNGDGIEEIGVYRQGTWYVDTDGNRRLDDHDRAFNMGSASDQPVVGDWNGDGKDEPGLYQNVKEPQAPPPAE